jgi:uncharacterized protein (TIGR03083 family)
VINSIRPEQWQQPGLGVWTVRELAAHALRSFTLIAEYSASDPSAPIDAADAVGYYRAIFVNDHAAIHAAVAERGRQSGAALGDEPAAAIRERVREVMSLLPNLSDDQSCVTPFGNIRLIDYLHTRLVELVVHGLDLCRAIGRPLDAPVVAVTVAMQPLLDFGDPRRMLLAITGRELYDVLG